jgi:hypothetical protein
MEFAHRARIPTSNACCRRARTPLPRLKRAGETAENFNLYSQFESPWLSSNSLDICETLASWLARQTFEASTDRIGNAAEAIGRFGR